MIRTSKIILKIQLTKKYIKLKNKYILENKFYQKFQKTHQNGKEWKNRKFKFLKKRSKKIYLWKMKKLTILFKITMIRIRIRK